MNIKTILASTLLTAFFAGTTAFAEDRDNLFEWEFNYTPSESVNKNKVTYQAPTVSVDDEVILSGRRSESIVRNKVTYQGPSVSIDDNTTMSGRR